MPAPYYGKYRGLVKNNVDLLNQGRLQVSCPVALGTGKLSWAMPCVPYAASGKGLLLTPPRGASVWVEFEAGNPDKPIWSGCFWGQGEVPSSGTDTQTTIPHIAMQTTAQTTFLLSDAPGPTGGIILKISTGAKIEINTVGITISNCSGATIELTGPSVKINGTAFVVT